MDNLQAVTFDVFGTVVDWRNSIAREVQAILDPRGVDVNWHAFADAWRARYQPSMERIRSGSRGWTKLDVLHYENLMDVLETFQISGLDEPTLQHLNRSWHRLDPWPDVVEGLLRLKTRYILGTVSNGNIALMVNLAKNASLPWDVVLGAEVAQAYKPEPNAYIRSAAALDLDPSQCMLVAAHNSDLMAAASTGFRTAFVARPTEYGPEQTTDQRAEHDFDIVAKDFKELADHLET